MKEVKSMSEGETIYHLSMDAIFGIYLQVLKPHWAAYELSMSSMSGRFKNHLCEGRVSLYEREHKLITHRFLLSDRPSPVSEEQRFWVRVRANLFLAEFTGQRTLN